MDITLYYLSPVIEGSGPSLPSERSFRSYKAMSQFIRRNKIEKFVPTVGGIPHVLLGTHYYPVSYLGLKMSSVLSDFAIVNPV